MISFGQLLEVDDKYNKKDDKHTRIKVPWVDKYRPSSLDDIVYQTEVTKMLKNVLKTGNLPHTLFYGPSGSGKTSTILAIAKTLFGPNKFSERVIELNASDERGINVVRNKIVTFARASVGSKDPDYLCPPYKLIILDEADAMTNEAQSALRKTMEDNSSITRFCFICNYINQIINPITSRCVKFRFKSLDNSSIINRLKFVSRKEKMDLRDDVLNEIANIVDGDMRKALMLLQNVKYLGNMSMVTPDDILDIAGDVPSSIINLIKESCINKNSNISRIIKLTKSIRSYGYPIDNILKKINKLIINDDDLDDEMKSKICITLSNTERQLIDGADEYLQLLNIFINIYHTWNQ